LIFTRVLERLIEELVSRELDTLLERTRAKPQIVFHGTSSDNLSKIFELGMIPNPTKGKWKGDEEFTSTAINSPSLHSLEGSYWTDNIGIAYSSARQALAGTDARQMVVIAQIVPQTAVADEDDVRPVVERAFREAYRDSQGARDIDLAAPAIHAQIQASNSFYLETLGKFAKYIHEELKTSDKMPLNMGFFRDVFEATLNRILGYVNWEREKWHYIEAYQRELENKHDLDVAKKEALKMKDNLPTFDKAAGERDFLQALDKVSRRYRKSALPPGDSLRFRTNLRVTEPVGFKGRNKILAFVIGFGEKIEVVYGEVPQKFIKDYAQFWGPNFKIVDRKGKLIHGSTMAESSQKIDRYLEEKLELKSYKNFCSIVADAYDELPDYDPEAVESYKSLIQHIEKMYKRMLSKVKVDFVSGQPYNSQKEMSDKVKETGILKISTDYNEHDIFSPEQNLKFRAVHDYIVHILTGVDFSDKGEVAAFNAHAKLLPQKAIPAAFTEIVGQACYANSRGTFPKQKIAIMKGFDFKNVGKVEGYQVNKKELVKQEEEEQQQQMERPDNDINQTID